MIFLIYGKLTPNGKNKPEGRLSRLYFTAELGWHTICIIPPCIITSKANVNIISLKEHNAALSSFWTLALEPRFYEASVHQSCVLINRVPNKRQTPLYQSLHYRKKMISQLSFSFLSVRKTTVS